jgi:hypothetical protein
VVCFCAYASAVTETPLFKLVLYTYDINTGLRERPSVTTSGLDFDIFCSEFRSNSVCSNLKSHRPSHGMSSGGSARSVKDLFSLGVLKPFSGKGKLRSALHLEGVECGFPAQIT